MSQSDTPLLEEEKQHEEDKQEEEANNSNKNSLSTHIISQVLNVWLSIHVTFETLNNKAEQFIATLKIDMYFNKDLSVYLNQFSDIFRRVQETMYEVTNLAEILMTDISLPIHPSRIFAAGSCVAITHLQPPKLEYHDDVRNLVHICYEFKATLRENWEAFAFPFDGNYLNLKLQWNGRDFHMLRHFDMEDRIIAAQIIHNDKDRYNDPLISNAMTSKMDEIAADTFHMLSPCVHYGFAPDSGKQSLWFRFRLRVRRKPSYHMIRILFPVFIIVSVGFSIFAVNDKATRLEMSLAILLILTAFQSLISAVLPDKSRMTLISWYIFIAYIIQTILIVSSCFGPYYDDYFLGFCVSIWGLLSVAYITFSCDCMQKKWQHCYPRLGWKEARGRKREEWQKRARIYPVDEAHYNYDHVPSIHIDANPLTQSARAPIKHQQNKPAPSTLQQSSPLLSSHSNSASMANSGNVPKQVHFRQSRPKLHRNQGSKSAPPRSTRNVNRRSASWNSVDSDEGSLSQIAIRNQRGSVVHQSQDTPQLQQDPSQSHSEHEQQHHMPQFSDNIEIVIHDQNTISYYQ